MSALSLTDAQIEEIEEMLSFSSNPIYEKGDIECVIFALRAQDAPLQWLRYRARLFDNPDIVTKTESVLDALKKKVK